MSVRWMFSGGGGGGVNVLISVLEILQIVFVETVLVSIQVCRDNSKTNPFSCLRTDGDLLNRPTKIWWTWLSSKHLKREYDIFTFQASCIIGINNFFYLNIFGYKKLPYGEGVKNALFSI